MITDNPLAAVAVKTDLDDVCLMEGDGHSPNMYRYLQGGDDEPVREHDVLPAATAGAWSDQAEADLSALVARFCELRPLTANHRYIEDDPADASPQTVGRCISCGSYGMAGHGQLLSRGEVVELAQLRRLLPGLENVYDEAYPDGFDCEPDIPAGWVVLRDTLVPDYARAHDLTTALVRDRAEHTLDYHGVRFVAFLEAMLHDGIRHGLHTGHEIQFVQPDTIEYCREVVRVVDGELFLAEETTEDWSPSDPHLYCFTCEQQITPDEIGAGALTGLG